jgi:hypothetical protein
MAFDFNLYCPKCTYRYTERYSHHGQTVHLNITSRSACRPLLEMHAQFSVVIFNYSEIQCTYLFFCCYLLDVYIGSPLHPHYPTESHLCEVLLEAPKNAQSHVISCTSAAFQFHYLPNDVSLPLYDEVKLRYSNSLWTHKKLNTLCISATMQAFGCDHRKAIFSYNCSGRAWHCCRQQNFLSSLLDSHTFTFLSV